MKSLIIGIAAIFLVFALSIGGNLSTYFNPHTFIIVLGGTLGVLFFSTSDAVLAGIVRACKDLFSNEKTFNAYKEELIQLAEVQKLSQKSNNPLIQYAQELWEQGIDEELFIALLSQKRFELENHTLDVVQALKNLSKYPPALGMVGTVMGMVGLFATLNENRANIGIHLSLALTATFFGLLLTNAIIAPLADRLQVSSVNQKRLYMNVYQILLLINRKEPLALITGEMEVKVA